MYHCYYYYYFTIINVCIGRSGPNDLPDPGEGRGRRDREEDGDGDQERLATLPRRGGVRPAGRVRQSERDEWGLH